MEITIHVKFDEKIADALIALAGMVSTKTEGEAKADPPKRRGRRKAAESTPETTPETEPDDSATGTGGATRADVKAALLDYTKRTSREDAVKLLGKFGAKSISTLDEKHYADIIAATQEGDDAGDPLD